MYRIVELKPGILGLDPEVIDYEGFSEEVLKLFSLIHQNQPDNIDAWRQEAGYLYRCAFDEEDGNIVTERIVPAALNCFKVCNDNDEKYLEDNGFTDESLIRLIYNDFADANLSALIGNFAHAALVFLIIAKYAQTMVINTEIMELEFACWDLCASAAHNAILMADICQVDSNDNNKK